MIRTGAEPDPGTAMGFRTICCERMQSGIDYYYPFNTQFSLKAMCADVGIALLVSGLPAGIWAYAGARRVRLKTSEDEI